MRIRNGNIAISGSLEATGSSNIPYLTGSLYGTASWATNALTASYVAVGATASYSVTSSLSITSSYSFTSSNSVSSSFSTTSSYAQSASIATTSLTASYIATASWANNAISSSYAQTASWAINALTASSADNFTVRGTLTAQTIVAQTITSSTEYITGSTQFGSIIGNTHQFTGSVSISGSLSVNNNTVITSAQTSSMTVLSSSYANTSSFATTALTASYLSGSVNAISSLNGLTAVSQSFVTGSAGDDFNISSIGATHSFNIPTASATTLKGLITNNDQSISGYKTFNQGLYGYNITADQNFLARSYVELAGVGFPYSTGYLTPYGSPFGTSGFTLSGSATYAWAVFSAYYSPITNIYSNYNGALVLIGENTIQTDTTGTHPLLSQLAIKPFKIGVAGGAAVTNTATVYIEEAGQGGTNNYALWVDSGSSRFDDNIILTSGAIMLGTASWANNAISSSYALTASYALNTIPINTGSFVTTSSFNSFTASYNTGSFTGGLTGSVLGTASWAINSLTASYIPASGVVGLSLNQIATGSVTASVNLGTGSFTLTSGSNTFVYVGNSGNMGLGVSPAQTTLHVNQKANTTKGILISGDEVFTTGNGTNTDGVRISLGVSRSGNRQLWIGDNSAYGSSTLSIFRYITGIAGWANIDSVTGDGNTRLLTILGTDTSNIGVGYDANSPTVASYTGKLSVFVYNEARTSLFLKKGGTGVGYFIDSVNNSGVSRFIVDVNGQVFAAGGASITGSLIVSGSSHNITGSLNAPVITGSLFGTASWSVSASSAISSSYALSASSANNSITASYILTASFANNATNASTASYIATASWATNSLTASYVNTLNQNVLITGSLTVGAASLGVPENTLTLGARGTQEGGQLLLQAGTSYTSASMFDVYQDSPNPYLRILRGSNAGSDALVAQFNLHTKQFLLPAYTNASSFTGTPTANLAVDANGAVITVSTSGGTVFPYTGNAVISGSLNVTSEGGYTGNITASGAIRSLANNAMYFRGGDDAEFWDINVSNTVAIYGQQDATVAGLKLGSGGGTIFGKSGNIGIGTITPTSGTLQVNGNVFATSFTGSLLGTASFSTNTTSASYAQTSSWAVNALTASSADNFTVRGTLTAQTIVAQVITASTEYVTGSTQFGSIVTNTHQFTGSVSVSGSLSVNNSNVITSAQTSSMSVLSSSYALTSSYVKNADSASYYLIVTGSAGSDVNIVASLSGSTINIPNASTTARGLVTTGTQTFDGTKTFNGSFNAGGGFSTFTVIGVNSSNLSAAPVSDLLGVKTSYKLGSIDSSGISVGVNGNAGAWLLLGKNGIQTTSGGSHPLFANVAIKSPIITLSGGGIVTSSAALYIEVSGSSNAINNYSIWVSGSSGSSARFDSSVIISGPVKLTGSLDVTAGVTGSLLGTASWATNALTSSYITTASWANNAITSLTASYVNPLNQDVVISGSLNVTGSITSSFIGNPNGDIVLSAKSSSINTGSVEIQGGLKWKRTSTAVATEIGDLITFGGTLGLIDGGTLTTSSVGGLVAQVGEAVMYTMTTFPYSAHNLVKYSTIGTTDASRQITLPQTSSVYVYYNNSGVLTTGSTAPSSRSNIILGKVTTDASSILYIDASQINAHHYSNYVDRLLREALGTIFSTGGITTQGTTSGSLNVTAATYFFSQNRYTTTGASPITMDAFYRSSVTGQSIRTTGVSLVSTSSYDSGSGALVNIPIGKYTKHSLYLLNNSLQATAKETYLLVYGQTLYDTVGEAEAGGLPTPPSFFTDAIPIIASLVVTPTSQSIQAVIDERPRLGFVSPSKTGVITAHGDLTGLSNDDHPQYLLVDGTRQMSGNLGLGGNSIYNVSSISASGALIPSITGSLQGTASWATNVLTASGYLPLSGGTVTGNLVINQNLTVLGSASITYLTQSNLNIGTNIITVNSNLPTVRYGGLAVIDSGSVGQRSGSFLFDSSNDNWIFIHQDQSVLTSSLFILGPETYNNLGNETRLTKYVLPKAVGKEHLGDSSIQDDGTKVAISSSTDITGSLYVSGSITATSKSFFLSDLRVGDRAYSNTDNLAVVPSASQATLLVGKLYGVGAVAPAFRFVGGYTNSNRNTAYFQIGNYGDDPTANFRINQMYSTNGKLQRIILGAETTYAEGRLRIGKEVNEITNLEATASYELEVYGYTYLSQSVGIGIQPNTSSANFSLNVSGSGTFINGLTVSSSLNAPNITGSLLGTASWATSASVALTASYLLGTIQSASYSLTSSNIEGGQSGYLTMFTGSNTTVSSSLIYQPTNTYLIVATNSYHPAGNFGGNKWTQYIAKNSNVGSLMVEDRFDVWASSPSQIASFVVSQRALNNTAITFAITTNNSQYYGSTIAGDYVFHLANTYQAFNKFVLGGVVYLYVSSSYGSGTGNSNLVIGDSTNYADLGRKLQVFGNVGISGSLNITSSLTAGTTNSTHVVSGSFNAPNITGSLLGTSSWATNALTASSADNFNVRNTLTAQTLVVQTITASIEYLSGSTQFGDAITDTHNFTGSVNITGSLSLLTGSATITSITGSVFGTSSWAVSASWAPGGGGLKTKSGGVSGSTFTGNPKKATVTFAGAYSNDQYSVTITGEDARTWTIESKAAGSFVINSNSNTVLSGITYWQTIAYGETS